MVDRSLASIPGVVVAERHGLGIATVMARRGRQDALVDRIAALFGIDLPLRPGRVEANGIALVATGPGVWMMIRDSAPGDWALSLSRQLDGLASVSDQSSAYVVLRFEGPQARELLSRGAYVDFHPGVFGPGSAAVTVIAHIGIVLWPVDTDCFEVALFRSYLASFFDWLRAAGAGLGD